MDKIEGVLEQIRETRRATEKLMEHLLKMEKVFTMKNLEEWEKDFYRGR